MQDLQMETNQAIVDIVEEEPIKATPVEKGLKGFSPFTWMLAVKKTP